MFNKWYINLKERTEAAEMVYYRINGYSKVERLQGEQGNDD